MNKIFTFSLFWFIWLALVILWNFGFPQATPILDVLIAVVLSLLFASIKKDEK